MLFPCIVYEALYHEEDIRYVMAIGAGTTEYTHNTVYWVGMDERMSLRYECWWWSRALDLSGEARARQLEHVAVHRAREGLDAGSDVLRFLLENIALYLLNFLNVYFSL